MSKPPRVTSLRLSVRSAIAVLTSAVLGLITAVPILAYPRPGTIERISIGDDGAEGNFDALNPAISAEGRFVAFESISNTLVAGDNNARSDVFVRDRVDETLAIVSRASDGTLSDGRSHDPSMSADGRFIAFESLATNLVPGDTNGTWDVFVHDRQEQITQRVSVSSDGAEHNARHIAFQEARPSISADGRFVVFSSRASNLVPGDLNNVRDVFVHDRQTGNTERVSVSETGTEGNAHSHNELFAVSADGRFVAFQSQASTLVVGTPEISEQIYRKDLVTGAIELISASNDGASGNQGSFSASISADGSIVAFDSFADNLVPNQEPGSLNVFVRDVARGRIHRASVTSSGQAANDASERGVVSPGGRFVLFSSWATNLSDEKDGRWPDVFVHDRVTGEVQQASLSAEGRSLPLGASPGVMSADSSVVAFQSVASGYVPGDTNDRRDIFTRERGPAVGIVDGPHVTLKQERIEVGGSAVFSGVVLTAADDTTDDGQVGAALSGTELEGAQMAYRPELEDLGFTLRAHRIEGPAAPDSLLNIYGLSFEIADVRHEIRSAQEGNSRHGRHVLLRCDPVCVEVAELQGSIGEAGDEVRVSLPLETMNAQEGDELTAIRAFSGRGSTASGSFIAQDEVELSDAAVPTSVVEVGLVPAGTHPSEVIYQVVADVDDGVFSAELPRSGWAPGDYDVWARACLDEVCGKSSTPLVLEDPVSSPSPTGSASPSASPSPSPTGSPSFSPSPSPSATQSPSPSPSSSVDPLCPPGRKCETWAARHGRSSEGVGFPRSVATDDKRVYVSGAWGTTFFTQDLHTIAYDAKTGMKLWGAAYNGPQDDSEYGWATAAAPDGSVVFSGGESKGDNEYPDLLVVAYEGTTGQQRWIVRHRGRFEGINGAKELVVSHDSRTLFVAGRVTEHGMAGDFGTLAYDTATGERLWYSTYNGTLPGYDEPQGIALSPDGATLYVTGHSWGRNSSFDYGTVAYDTNTGQQLWVARYDADFERELAAGVVVSPDGKRVYVTGSGISGTEDYATVAYDAATGTELWAKLYDHADNADRAFGIAMDPRGEFVVVTGRSRGADTGDDFATVAYDAATGDELWVERFHGPTVSGHDEASAVQVSPGGSRIFVTGTAATPNKNLFINTDAVTIAYSRTGEMDWQASYDDTGGEDDPLAMAMSSDGSWVYPAGRTMHAESSLSTSSLAQFLTLGYETGISEPPDPRPTPTPSATETMSPSPTPTATSSPSPTDNPSPSPSESGPAEKAATEMRFTDANASAGQHSDVTRFEARLSDADGAAIAGAEVVFTLAGAESERSLSATTDNDGVAAVIPTLEEKPGPYQLTVRFAGDDDHRPSGDSTGFVVDKEDTAVELTVEGKGSNRTLTARLADADTRADGVADRTIDFYGDGEHLGSAITDENGVATLKAPPRYRGGKHEFEARFEGDDFFHPTSASYNS